MYEELKNTLKSDESAAEAKIILETVLGVDRNQIFSKPELILTQNQLAKILQIREERNTKKIPLAYILEEAPFMDLKLFVNEDVLIPRPETELLVEKVLAEIKDRKIVQPVILDLGTGSACIAIALKRALPAATVFASDISSSALNVAAINARRYSADINFVLGDYLDPFLHRSHSPIAVPIMNTKPPYFDVLVSNPPYISQEDYENLELELFHEPKHALVGFPYAYIKKQAQSLIKSGGFMAFEFGQGQTEKLLEIFPGASVYKDYAGIERIILS
jgi:release factor glutamine methyltransferase